MFVGKLFGFHFVFADEAISDCLAFIALFHKYKRFDLAGCLIIQLYKALPERGHSGGITTTCYQMKMRLQVIQAALAKGIDNPDIKNTIMRNKNSYLVQIGTDNKKYCYLYEPDAYKNKSYLSGSTIFSFGGSRRDIFEKTLLSLKVGKLFVFGFH